MKNILSRYNRNEAVNAHSENAVLLAEAFGTEAEQKQAHEFLKLRNANGYADRDASFFQAEMSRKYYAKARAAIAKATQ